MTDAVPTYQPFDLSATELRTAVLRYASNPVYRDNDAWTNEDNPYRRQLRPQGLGCLDFSRPLRRDGALRYASLAAQRLLTCIYEADLVLLPKGGVAARWDDFKAFYSPSNRALGEMIRPALERFAFG